MVWVLGSWRAEARCNLTGSFLAPESAGSLGLRVKRTAEGQFTVINMEPDSPSSKVLHLGDSIFALGGALTENMTLADFSSKLKQLRGRDVGNVTVGYSTDHCSEGGGDEEDEDDEEDEEEELEQGIIAHYRVMVEHFHQPLGLRLSQNDEGMVVVGKTASLEQWEAVEVGDVLEQIHGEDVVSSAKLKHLLQRFEGRKQLGILFSRVLSPEPPSQGSEEALRMTFSIQLSTAEAAAGLELAQLERTVSELDGYLAVTTSAVPYVFPGDRLREINSVPVTTLKQATLLLADGEMVELLFVRGVKDTLVELETVVDDADDVDDTDTTSANTDNNATNTDNNTTNTPDPEECNTADELESLELLKQEAEAKVKEAEELTQQAAEAEAVLLKKLEAKELQKKQDEDRLARLKATRTRLDDELRALEEEERLAGLTPTPAPTGACDKHAIAKLLADPEFMQSVVQLLLLARQV